ncbi:putative mannose-6-phosphate isomerase GmuF [bacterium HR36]|nr:putative mannose-6-phosphate isomerase GmuF [bacterium HR36]
MPGITNTTSPPEWLMQPLLLEPYLRPMPWGGNRLPHWLGLSEPGQPIGEAWLVSDHHLHTSRILNAPDTSQTLRTLMARWPKAVAGYLAPRFPLLIKIIDARENLSVQVHPDDASAQHWAPQQGGKTEAWLVLDTTAEGKIYLGLRPGITKEVLTRELALDALPLCLNTYFPRIGECYYVPAGTVHALGAGVSVLEVQQTSDATFRLYDWGRLDPQGKPRPLHIEAALAVLREHTPEAGLQTPVRLNSDCELLVNTPFFTLYRLNVAAQQTVAAPAIIVPLHSSANLTQGETNITIPAKHAALLPALAGEVQLRTAKSDEVILITWPLDRATPSE